MTEPNPGVWTECRPGELEQFAARLTFVRRLRIATVAGLTTLVVAGTVGGSWYAFEKMAVGASQSQPEDPECGDCGKPATAADAVLDLQPAPAK